MPNEYVVGMKGSLWIKEVDACRTNIKLRIECVTNLKHKRLRAGGNRNRITLATHKACRHTQPTISQVDGPDDTIRGYYLDDWARESAGEPELQVKDLRRHYAIILAEGGTDMHDIQQVLEHTSVATTEKHYDQFSPKHSARKVLKILEGVLKKVKKRSV